MLEKEPVTVKVELELEPLMLVAKKCNSLKTTASGIINCKNCKHFFKSVSTYGYCHRYPPGGWNNSFPIVPVDAHCAEATFKPDKENKNYVNN